MRLNPESIARASSRHPWRTVGVWALVLFAGFAALSTLLSPALSNDFDFTNSPEAIQAQKLLEQEGLEQDVSPESFVLVGGRGATSDPAFADKVNAALDDLRALDPSVVLVVPSGVPPLRTGCVGSSGRRARSDRFRGRDGRVVHRDPHR
jgi:uncharacterized membrane protein YdfJ with MMPL/SSD domain